MRPRNPGHTVSEVPQAVPQKPRRFFDLLQVIDLCLASLLFGCEWWWRTQLLAPREPTSAEPATDALDAIMKYLHLVLHALLSTRLEVPRA